MAVVLKIEEELRRHEVQTVLTRTKDTFVSLKDRASKANEVDAKIFVSIHCNSAANEGANGTEVYYSVGSNSGKLLARTIHSPLIRATGLSDRGVKSARFYVLRHTRMPATLVELAFISNPNEEELLRSEEFQARVAGAIAAGVMAYLAET